MRKPSVILLGIAALLVSGVSLAGDSPPAESVLPWLSGEHVVASDEPEAPRIFLPSLDQDSRLRPVLSVSLLDEAAADGRSLTGQLGGWLNRRFFWSLESEYRPPFLQPNAHIHCQRGTLTATAYRAEECSFIDQPLPDDSLSLMQVRGQWLATSNVSLGLGVFRGEAPATLSPLMPAFSPVLPPTLPHDTRKQTEGIDLGVSVGLDFGHLGDLMVDLQLARYRDTIPGLSGVESRWFQFDSLPLDGQRSYHNAAQLSLGWQHGDFSTNIQGRYRDNISRAGSGLPPASLNTFDIEFAWRTSWNASLSVGANNLLRAHPKYEGRAEPVVEDLRDQPFGRIPYVRYKQDL